MVVIRNDDLWWQWPQVARVKCGEGVERCRKVSSGEKGVDSGSATPPRGRLERRPRRCCCGWSRANDRNEEKGPEAGPRLVRSLLRGVDVESWQREP